MLLERRASFRPQARDVSKLRCVVRIVTCGERFFDDEHGDALREPFDDVVRPLPYAVVAQMERHDDALDVHVRSDGKRAVIARSSRATAVSCGISPAAANVKMPSSR